MALKGLTKSAQESKSTDQKIEDFISGSAKRVKSLETSQQVYRRFTFSLTEEVSKEIDDLLIDARVAKANRSVILKAALHQLQKLSKEDLQQAVLSEVK
jgi:predicted transcriptional regulator